MSIFQLIRYIRIVMLFAIPFVTKLDFSDLSDPDRKSSVVEQLQQQLTTLDVKPPKWAEDYIEPLLGILVDLVVYLLKRVNFLERGSEKYTD